MEKAQYRGQKQLAPNGGVQKKLVCLPMQGITHAPNVIHEVLLMLTLIDGPCKGTYMCKRAPVFLRAVKGLDNAGNCDVLDQVDDTPNSGEKVYVYELQGKVSTAHLNFGGGRGGWYAMASYHYLPDIDGEQLRDNVSWQEWATARNNKAN